MYWLFAMAINILVVLLPASIVLTIIFSIKKRRLSLIAISIPSVVAICVSLVLISVLVEQNSSTITNETECAKVEESDVALEYEEDGVTISFLKSEVADGLLYVYFEMENNSGENQKFNYNYSVIAFQDGVELETNYVFDCEEERNASKEIKDGTKIDVAETFELRNSDSNVEIEVEDWINFTDEKLLEFEVELE